MDKNTKLNKVTQALKELQKALNEEGINPRNGLPLDLFLFATTLLPFVNVDLLVLDEHRKILLSWRDDLYYGKGWQLPGGCIRLKENILSRIQKTAFSELGSEVICEKNPLAVRECILPEYRKGLENQLERSHNIVLLYECSLPSGFYIDNKQKTCDKEGYLKWFDHIPDNLLECHKIAYLDILKKKISC